MRSGREIAEEDRSREGKPLASSQCTQRFFVPYVPHATTTHLPTEPDKEPCVLPCASVCRRGALCGSGATRGRQRSHLKQMQTEGEDQLRDVARAERSHGHGKVVKKEKSMGHRKVDVGDVVQ